MHKALVTKPAMPSTWYHSRPQADQNDHSSSSDVEPEDSAGDEPSSHHRPEALLINLSKYSNQPGMLHMKIIEHAVDFNRPEVLGELQTGKYDWMQ